MAERPGRRPAGAGRSRRGAREVALRACLRVEEGARSREALEAELARAPGLAAADRHLATELTYGTVRWLRRFDFLLARTSRRPLARLQPPLRWALRMALYQLEQMKIPEHAALHETLEALRAVAGPAPVGYANGVLREALRRRGEWSWPDDGSPGSLAVRHSFPDWLARRWVERYGGEEAERLMRTMNVPPPLTVRLNRLRARPQEALERLRAAGLEARAGRYEPQALEVRGAAPRELPGWEEGWYQVQSEASILVGRTVGARPGERVLDVAAAPGGKSTHLAEQMEDRGLVLAVDVDARRLGRVEENARRLGLRSIRVLAEDARHLAERLEAASFDRLLVDAPCTGTGVLNRRAEARWRKRPQDVGRAARLQAEILDGVAPLLRRGGTLVYSTCTLEPEENRETVESFLRRWPGYRWDPLAPWLPPALAGRVEREGEIQFLPQRDGLDGHYIARLVREA
ncbi:MAG: 16S rRNA (cytosine(967)-C(5))-methyltransferase RsmB [Bacillota bacterium]|nr:16S rRNA (cytosine(967)-C(5))-methyltransferase RsmB [Bacillota bacterium]